MNTQCHVYVVDDDPTVRETLANVFDFAGFQVTCFDDAKSVLENELQAENACIVLDLRMPEMSGLELQQALLKAQVYLPVVIYTGNADVGTAVKAINDGAFTLLQKPASNQELVNAVNKAIENWQKDRLNNAQIEHAKAMLESLSKRELEIAELLADGYKAAKIGELLNISTRTVETHRVNIFNKLKIKSVATLAKYIVLVDLD